MIGAICAAVGGLVGGAIYISLSGVILGILMGFAVCGALAMLASLFALVTGDTVEPAFAQAAGSPAYQSSLPGVASVGQASTNTVNTVVNTQGSSTPANTVAQNTLPPEVAALAPDKFEVTQTEAQLMADGKFAEYHLAKAKRLFDAGNMKEAAYQAGASLSHATSAGATELRKAALAANK